MNELIRSEGAGIYIECREEDFGKLLFELLKSPRTTSHAIPMVFDIGRQEIYDVISLIKQRVEDQHRHSVVESEAVVRFEDGTETKIGDLEEFKSYADIGSKLADQVSVKLSFLIQTPKDPTPHKQSVSINFVADHFSPPQLFDASERAHRDPPRSVWPSHNI